MSAFSLKPGSEQKIVLLKQKCAHLDTRCIQHQGKRSGGGIAVIYKDSIPIKNSVYDYISMECADFTVTLPYNTISLSVIYRPPDKSILSFADA